mgnify:CR=1 FL=1
MAKHKSTVQGRLKSLTQRELMYRLEDCQLQQNVAEKEAEYQIQITDGQVSCYSVSLPLSISFGFLQTHLCLCVRSMINTDFSYNLISAKLLTGWSPRTSWSLLSSNDAGRDWECRVPSEWDEADVLIVQSWHRVCWRSANQWLHRSRTERITWPRAVLTATGPRPDGDDPRAYRSLPTHTSSHWDWKTGRPVAKITGELSQGKILLPMDI